MVDLRDEADLRGLHGVAISQVELEAELATLKQHELFSTPENADVLNKFTFVRCVWGPIDLNCKVAHVVLGRSGHNSRDRVLRETLSLLQEQKNYIVFFPSLNRLSVLYLDNTARKCCGGHGVRL